MDHQQSGSWIHDRDEGEDEQVLQPKIKRKRSIRIRPRIPVERAEEKSIHEKQSIQRGDSSQLSMQVDHKYEAQLRSDPEAKLFVESGAFKHEQSDSSLKSRRNPPSRRIGNTSKLHSSPKSAKLNCMSARAEDVAEHSRESWDGKVVNTGGPSVFGPKMSESLQRKVYTVEFAKHALSIVISCVIRKQDSFCWILFMFQLRIYHLLFICLHNFHVKTRCLV